MTDPQAARPLLLRRADALSDGLSDGEIARAVRRRELIRLQRGTYVREPVTLPIEPVARHRLAVVASVADLRVTAVVSHVSAAALHGLPLWNVHLDRVHILRRPPASGTGSTRLRLHVARLEDDDISVVDGLPVTSVTRTVVDVARTCPFESAVVLADRALRLGATAQETLRECLRAMGPVPGARRAARVIDFANALAESVGESRSRALMHRLRLPTPDLQVRVRRRDRSIIGRCDFGWEEFRTLGEFDGRIKYGRLLKPGQTAGDVVFEEKRREDELRDHRWEVARWTWDDLDHPQVVEHRIRRAFARGRR